MRRSAKRMLWLALLVGGVLLVGSERAAAQSDEAAQTPLEQMPSAREEPSTKPADAYGIRYATRKLVMPKGMIRGTFDIVIGNYGAQDGFDPVERSTSLNFGVALSPGNNFEIGFSRYRMGSYPNPDLFRAFGGDGLIPIVAQGGEFVPPLRTKGDVFGDMVFYTRAQIPDTKIVDVGFDLGFLLPTASEFGLLIGLPIRIHGGEVFAFDTGVMIAVDDVGGSLESFASVLLPWNVVFSVTDEFFFKINSGLDAIDVGSDFTLKVFPLGFGIGVTASGERLMSDVFAAFSWPLFAIVEQDFPGNEVTTDIWTITIGVTFYSPVLF